MTGLQAYILARKIALGAVSGISNITLSPTGTLVFQFKDGSQTSWQIPLPKDGVDGISVTNVQIDTNNHLICTLSDGSTVDAGALPDKSGGGLIQVSKFNKLPYPGEEDSLYLVQEEEILYYWNKNKYNPLTGGAGAKGIDFCTGTLNPQFDGVETVFTLPIDNKSISVYINGMYLTEDEDYTIDRSVTPNTIEFIELWEDTDLCTIVWVKGKVEESAAMDKINIDKLNTDVTQILNATAFIQDTAIASPWPVSITISAAQVLNLDTVNQKKLAKVIYVLNNQKQIVGCGNVNSYSETSDEFTLALTKYGNSDIDLGLASTTDIDKLFETMPPIPPETDIYAKTSDIDKLFANEPLGLADITDIDKIFM